MRLHIPRSQSVAVAVSRRFPVLTDAPAWAVTAQWPDADADTDIDWGLDDNIVWGTLDNIVWGTTLSAGGVF